MAKTKQYFCAHRLYRNSDSQYWTLGIKWDAESLGELDRLIGSYESALKLAGADKLTLEKISIDFPGDSGSYNTIFDTEVQREIQVFLGLKRDRRPRAAKLEEVEENSELPSVVAETMEKLKKAEEQE